MKKIRILSIFFLLLYITACSNNDEEKNVFTEKNTICLEAVNIGKDTLLNIAANDKNKLLEEETDEETGEETDEQPVETGQQSVDAIQEQQTANYIEKDTADEKRTVPQETKENINNTEFVENGTNIWRYASDMYPEGSEKAKLEEIFWREYGWATYCAEKNDKMAAAMVEMVSEIMNTYATDFEREKALYEKICLTCSYDHESLETGLTSEGQTPYGVLIERKAVCGGYAATFHLALSMMGIENILEIGMTTEGLHGWNKVCLEGDWYEVDVTWGDNDGSFLLGCEYDYDWFNLTTDEMSKTHERRGTICYGTKYGSQYAMEQNKLDFLNSTECIETTEYAYEYITEMLNENKGTVEFYTTNRVVKEIVNRPVDSNLEKELNIITASDYYFYNLATSSSEFVIYKQAYLDGVYKVHLEFEVLEDYRLKENYFETLEELYKYAQHQMQDGVTEINAYLGMNEEEARLKFDYSQLQEYVNEHGLMSGGVVNCSVENVCHYKNLCCLEIRLHKPNIQN